MNFFKTMDYLFIWSFFCMLTIIMAVVYLGIGAATRESNSDLETWFCIGLTLTLAHLGAWGMFEILKRYYQVLKEKRQVSPRSPEEVYAREVNISDCVNGDPCSVCMTPVGDFPTLPSWQRLHVQSVNNCKTNNK